MKKTILCFLVIFSLLLTACPKKVRDAVEAGARVNRLVKNLAKKTEESFDEKLISADIAGKATVLLDKAIPLADEVTDAAENLRKKFPKGKIPKSEFQTFRDAFEAFESPVLDILQLFGTLSDAQRAILEAAIEALKLALDLIKSGFGEAAIYYRRAERWTLA